MKGTIADSVTSAVSAAGLPISAATAGLEFSCEHGSISTLISGGVGGLSDDGVISPGTGPAFATSAKSPFEPKVANGDEDNEGDEDDDQDDKDNEDDEDDQDN